MRYWEYQDQAGTHTISDVDILRTYYPFWLERMKKIGKESEASKENCIQDFVTVHWASEKKKKSL